MKKIVSGIKPSGVVTLGNYLGSIKNFVKFQNENQDIHQFIFIADLHAITVPQDRAKLRESIKSLAALYLACGLKDENLTLFIQSEVRAHTELGHIFQCIGYMGEAERMTQYKDKKQKGEESISVGMLTYPYLMAGDILLYDADLVPVGEDQKQHLELTKTLANRFNHKFGDTFKVPDYYIPETGARIMSLTEPNKKMSKSDEDSKSFISLLDPINTIKNKIKSAVTDSEMVIKFDKENKPGISNLLTIYSSITGDSINSLEDKYANKNYGEFKSDLAEIVSEHISIIQSRYNDIINSGQLDDILDRGADFANKIANRKIEKVYHKVGLGRKKK